MQAIQENLAAASAGRFLADEPMLGAIRYPGDNCCILYEYENFAGQNRSFCHSGSKTTIHLDGDWWNNNSASWNCGKNVKYDFYDFDTDYSGWWYSIGGAGHANNSRLADWNDNITTLVLEPYDALVSGAITVFEFPNCQGTSARLEWKDDHELGGRYNASDMYIAGLKENMISSVAIPYGYNATLYSKNGFSGYTQKFNGRYSSSYVAAEMACQNSWENFASSVIVQKDYEAVATGAWESITTTESQSYELYIGLTRGHEKGASSEASSNITMAMELGVEFEGLFSAKEEITAEASQAIKSDVRDTYELKEGETIKTACTADGRDGAGLFQWVVSTGKGDDKITARTRHFLCRYGADDWNVAPACPWNACADAQCTTCRSGWKA